MGTALLLNALLATLAGNQAVAAAIDPFATALCGETGGPGDQPAPGSSQHRQGCPLCGLACPMGGCAPVAGPGTLALLPARPAFVGGVAAAFKPADPRRPPSLYRSDVDSQAPPAT